MKDKYLKQISTKELETWLIINRRCHSRMATTIMIITELMKRSIFDSNTKLVKK